MKTCELCQTEFPTWISIEGKRRNLNNRRYCLLCSPFKLHNTCELSNKINQLKPRKCSICGETDGSKFYNKRKKTCITCQNKDKTMQGNIKRKFAIDLLGGKCKICGYNKYYGSIDIHHLDPSKKDKNFSSLRSWRKLRILKEIKNCIALCKNCHSEVHAGLHADLV